MDRTGTPLNGQGAPAFQSNRQRRRERAHGAATLPPVTDHVRTPLPPLDRDAAERMWREYVAAHPARAAVDDEHPVEAFGDSVELADELIGLVLHGPKRATAGLVADFAVEGEPLPRIGGHWIACDGSGAPRAVLRTTELRIGPIESVDDAFAYDEGEGDRTRDDWLRGHRAYFTRTCAARGEQFTDGHEVVFERFAVAWPPGSAG
jgi:uncharacterized protein YhfF